MMSQSTDPPIRAVVDDVYRSESRRVLATVEVRPVLDIPGLPAT